jgi:hypothetical protein
VWIFPEIFGKTRMSHHEHHTPVDADADLVADGFGKDFRPDHIISRFNPSSGRGDPDTLSMSAQLALCALR